MSNTWKGKIPIKFNALINLSDPREGAPVTSDISKVSKPMSDSDIRKTLGKNIRIVTYPDLVNYTSIDDLLSVNDCCVILVETQLRSGHWICVLKYGNTVENFDSYGFAPDAEMSIISVETRKALKENEKYLSHLLDACDYNVVYNKKDFQKWDCTVATCGRFVCTRLLNRHLTLPAFTKMITSECSKRGISPDELVCEIVPK